MKLIRTCLVFLLVFSMPALAEEKKLSKWGIGLNTGFYMNKDGHQVWLLGFNIQHQISSRFAFQVEIERIHQGNNDFFVLMYLKGLLFLIPKQQDRKRVNFYLSLGIGNFLFFSDNPWSLYPAGFIKYGGGMTYRINSHLFTNFDLYLSNGWMYFPYIYYPTYLSLNLGLKYEF